MLDHPATQGTAGDQFSAIPVPALEARLQDSSLGNLEPHPLSVSALCCTSVQSLMVLAPLFIVRFLWLTVNQAYEAVMPAMPISY